MLVLGLDLETTTYDQSLLRVTEVGAVLYDTELKVPIEVQADLVMEPDNELPMDEFVVGLTGITDDMLRNYGKHPVEVIDRFLQLYKRAEFVVAHNGNEFDKPALTGFINRYRDQCFEPMPDYKLHWIDTMTDIPYNDYITTRKLEDLTGRHGFLNPFPHRAFTDVLAMLRIMSEYDFDEVCQISYSPELVFYANVDYHSRDVAKAARFRWDSEKRKWTYKIKKYFVDEEKRRDGTLWDFPYSEAEHTRNL